MSPSARWLSSAVAFVAIATALGAPLPAHAGISVTGKPKVSFFAAGSPGALDIEGVTAALTAADDGTKLVFTVPMKTVSTGIDMRDEHMNEKFVEVEKFPNAVLTVSKADVQWPATLAETRSGTVQAVFNIHGVDQPVGVAYTAQRTKTGYRVTAKFDFDASASNIAIPSYLGVTVDPKMHAAVKVDLIDA
jgi:polyisoprenoid-binding protein YceI